MAKKSQKQERALTAVQALKERYPDALCSLVYSKPYELMIAARLSAQCTDARVNIVTKDLFAEYPTLESFAEADPGELEKLLKNPNRSVYSGDGDFAEFVIDTVLALGNE